jgi:hypothetical protein
MIFKEFEYAEDDKKNDAFQECLRYSRANTYFFRSETAGIQGSNDATRYWVLESERVNY